MRTAFLRREAGSLFNRTVTIRTKPRFRHPRTGGTAWLLPTTTELFITDLVSQHDLRGRQRMMFMHDAPPVVNFTQTHGQPKFERFTFAACVNADAPPYRRSERDVLAASDLHIIKSKSNGLLNRGEKLFPGRHVVIQASR